MSLITSCPACSTMFRVVPDQLKVSDGWVRCGQCGEVFDASLHFVQAADANDLPMEGVASAPSARGADADLPDTPGQAPDHTSDQPPDQPPDQPADHTLTHDQAGLPRDVAASADILPAQWPSADEAAAVAPLADGAGADPSMPGPALAESLPDVSFVRQARRRAFWARPSVRVGMGIAALLLLALLLGQVAHHERDRLAAIEPRAAPWLERACEWVGCEIQPLRQIEWIAIDSSGFTKLRADTYRLQLVLKNVSPFDLAMPAIELTLTDTQDNAVVRRVITLDELGNADEVLRGGAEVNASAALGVSPAGTRVAGYRVLAFYP